MKIALIIAGLLILGNLVCAGLDVYQLVATPMRWWLFIVLAINLFAAWFLMKTTRWLWRS